jgi:Tfp pilus assembly protein PilO
MSVDVPRASAFAVVVIALAGYTFVFRPLETSAGDLYAQIDAARTDLDRSTAMAQRIPTLERERSALATELAHLHTGDRRATAVDRLLRTVAGVSAHDGVAVEAVTAGVTPQLTPAAAATPPPIEEVPFDLTLRGPYGDIIRAVRDLNDADGTARITVTSLSNAERRPGGSPQLNAAFHVLLLREAQVPPHHDVRPR